MTRLDSYSRARVLGLLDLLAEHGPALRMPHARIVKNDLFNGLLELRMQNPFMRVFYTFTPSRDAVLLLVDDKTGEWKAWYPGAIKEAHRIYQEYEASHEGAEAGTRGDRP